LSVKASESLLLLRMSTAFGYDWRCTSAGVALFHARTLT
jgi:hypothetical protein